MRRLGMQIPLDRGFSRLHELILQMQAKECVIKKRQHLQRNVLIHHHLNRTTRDCNSSVDLKVKFVDLNTSRSPAYPFVDFNRFVNPLPSVDLNPFANLINPLG